MGADLRTHFLPRVRLETVEHAVSAWLSAKGFEPADVAAPVSPDLIGGRGVVLAENDRGVAVAYSEPWFEGDRLAFELKRLGPVLLECWLHDSSIWGYRLYERGEVTAAFCSNPRYFGGESHDEDALRLGRNGDARLLTQTLGLPEKEQELRDLQTQKRVFAEDLVLRFAALLETPAIGFDYRMWEEYDVRATEGVREIAGHRVRGIVYLPREDGRARGWNLHRVPLVRLQPSESLGYPCGPEAVESMLWTIAIFRALALPIGLLLRVVMFPLALAIRLRPRRFLGRAFGFARTMQESPLHRALIDEAERLGAASRRSRGRANVVQEGDRVVHRGLGFAIDLAPGVTLADHPYGELCMLQAGGELGHFMPQGFESTETFLYNLVGEPIEDTKEFAGDLPLRMIVLDLAGGPYAEHLAQLRAKRSRRKRGWFGFGRRKNDAGAKADSDATPEPLRLFYALVQDRRFVHFLNIRLAGPSDETLEALKATMRSFRRIASDE